MRGSRPVSLAYLLGLTVLTVLVAVLFVQLWGRDFILAMIAEVVASLLRDVAVHWRERATDRGDHTKGGDDSAAA